jgi:type I restriction enzyme M protein
LELSRKGLLQHGGKIQMVPGFPMAVLEKVGFDRRGSSLHKRTPDGEVILREEEETDRIRIGGRNVIRRLKRKVPIVDDDLPAIADAYREFRKKHPEPGK